MQHRPSITCLWRRSESGLEGLHKDSLHACVISTIMEPSSFKLRLRRPNAAALTQEGGAGGALCQVTLGVGRWEGAELAHPFSLDTGVLNGNETSRFEEG